MTEFTYPQPTILPPSFPKFRAVGGEHNSADVRFFEREAMVEEAPRLARYAKGSLSLQISQDEAYPPNGPWVEFAVQEWDGGEPDPNPTILVEYTATVRVAARVRAFTYEGKKRELTEAMLENLHDALLHELQFEQPETDDLVQGVENAAVTDFEVLSVTDTGKTSLDDDED